MTTGANEDDWHLRGVDVGRDIAVDDWVELRTVAAGEPCPECGSSLDIKRVIEVGHIFKLGTEYTDALGATVLDENGVERVIIMGSYGIGVGRNVAAVIEANHDDKGIVWPVSVAPFEAVITVVKGDDPETAATADRIYEQLLALGVDAIIDDRAERPGVKFADAELVGIPYRITVGPRGLADGVVEILRRGGGDANTASPDEAPGVVAAAIAAERA